MLFYILYRNYIWFFSILAIAAAVAAVVYFAKKVRIVSLEEMKPSVKKDLLIGLRDNVESFSDLLEPLFVLAQNRSGRHEWVMNSWNDAVHSVEGNEEFKAAFDEKFFVLYGSADTKLTIDKKSATKREMKSYKAKKSALKEVRKVAKAVKKSENKKVKEDKKIAKLNNKLTRAKKDKKKNKISKKIAKIEKKYTKRSEKFAQDNAKLHVKYAGKLCKYLYKAGIMRHTDIAVTANETTSEEYDVIGNVSLEKDAVYDVHLPMWTLTVNKREGLEKLLANKDSVTAESEEEKEAAPAPTNRKEKKAAKKAAKKAKKASKKDAKKAKKAAKSDKKLQKKTAKLEKKLTKAKKAKKQAKINKKIAACEKKLSVNKALRAKEKALQKAINALPVESTETLVAKGAVK